VAWWSEALLYPNSPGQRLSAVFSKLFCVYVSHPLVGFRPERLQSRIRRATIRDVKLAERLPGQLIFGRRARRATWTSAGLLLTAVTFVAAQTVEPTHAPVAMQSPIAWVMQPETMLEVITEQRSTLAWMPNFAFQFIPRRTRENRRSRYDLSSLRALINCSEPVRTSSMTEFQEAFANRGLKSGALQSSYAMAENVFAVTQSDLYGEPRRIWADGKQFRASHRIEPVAEGTAGAMSLTSSGRLLPNHQVRIVSETGTVVNDGDVGEILVKSDCLFDGYYNCPDLTEKAIFDGWYRTGDLGFLLESELYVVGRKKDLIIVGGENLYPQDIEEIAGSHPGVHNGRVIALGVYNPELGTEGVVIVAEVESEEHLTRAVEIEHEIRSQIVSGLGVAPSMIFLKPPKWIVKSTAGKAARSTTLEKLRKEHPELIEI